MKGEYLKNHFRHETIKRPKQSGQINRPRMKRSDITETGGRET